MNRTVLSLFLVTLSLGCATTAERQALRPLPEDGAPVAFADLLTRARAQATVATEAFYVNNWEEMDDAAKGLEQTSRLLGKASDVPVKHKDALPVMTTVLAKQAASLREAIKAKQEDKANETLKQINAKVRELRLDN